MFLHSKIIKTNVLFILFIGVIFFYVMMFLHHILPQKNLPSNKNKMLQHIWKLMNPWVIVQNTRTISLSKMDNKQCTQPNFQSSE